MPRYFFHTACGSEMHRDRVGQEFPSASEALREARLLVGELVRDAAFSNRSLDQTVEVSDADGNVVISFRCCEPKLCVAQSG